MKTLFDDDEMLRADFPGGEDDDLESGADTGSGTAGEEPEPDEEDDATGEGDDEYIDVDEGEDEALDEQEALDSDDAAGGEEEGAEDGEATDEEKLNENEDPQAGGTSNTARGYAQKSALSGPANDLVSQPLIDGE